MQTLSPDIFQEIQQHLAEQDRALLSIVTRLNSLEGMVAQLLNRCPHRGKARVAEPMEMDADALYIARIIDGIVVSPEHDRVSH